MYALNKNKSAPVHWEILCKWKNNGKVMTILDSYIVSGIFHFIIFIPRKSISNALFSSGFYKFIGKQTYCIPSCFQLQLSERNVLRHKRNKVFGQFISITNFLVLHSYINTLLNEVIFCGFVEIILLHIYNSYIV